jgi:hypothetical protein
MARVRAQEMAASFGWDPRAQIVRHPGLPKPRNVVGFAFHGQERGRGDGFGSNSHSAPRELSFRQCGFVKYTRNHVDKEFRRQVDD